MSTSSMSPGMKNMLNVIHRNGGLRDPDGECRRTLSEETGLSISTIGLYLVRAEELGWITMKSKRALGTSLIEMTESGISALGANGVVEEIPEKLSARSRRRAAGQEIQAPAGPDPKILGDLRHEIKRLEGRVTSRQRLIESLQGYIGQLHALLDLHEIEVDLDPPLGDDESPRLSKRSSSKTISERFETLLRDKDRLEARIKELERENRELHSRRSSPAERLARDRLRQRLSECLEAFAGAQSSYIVERRRANELQLRLNAASPAIAP